MLDISNFPWAECQIIETRNLYVSDSLSLKRTKRNIGNHRFDFELVTVDMDLKQGRSVAAKLSAAVDDILLFVHPRLSYSAGTEPVTQLEVANSFSTGDKVISLTATTIWQLMAGDYIQFQNDSKVYQVAEDTALTTGQQTVTLTNAVRYNLTIGDNVKMNDIEWQLQSDGVIEMNMVASDNQDIQITLIAVEKL